MERREFIQFTVAGAAGLSLPLWACGSDRGAALPQLDYRVGQGYLVPSPGGRTYELEPFAHQVRELDSQGLARRIIGGLGTHGASLNNPMALCFDQAGTLYVLDRGNSRIQIYATDGSYLGQIASHGAGPAELSYPADMVIDVQERIWVSDAHNHRMQVFATSGEGLGGFGQLGTGAAQLNLPRGIAMDAGGNLHVVDSGNRRITVLTDQGRLVRSYGHRGDPVLRLPRAVAVDPYGRAYVADISGTHVFQYAADGELAGMVELRLADGQPATPIHLALGADESLLVTAIPGYAS